MAQIFMPPSSSAKSKKRDNRLLRRKNNYEKYSPAHQKPKKEKLTTACLVRKYEKYSAAHQKPKRMNRQSWPTGKMHRISEMKRKCSGAEPRTPDGGAACASDRLPWQQWRLLLELERCERLLLRLRLLAHALVYNDSDDADAHAPELHCRGGVAEP